MIADIKPAQVIKIANPTQQQAFKLMENMNTREWYAILFNDDIISGKEYGSFNNVKDKLDIKSVFIKLWGARIFSYFDGVQPDYYKFAVRYSVDWVFGGGGTQIAMKRYKITSGYKNGEVIKYIFPDGTIRVEDKRIDGV